MEHDNITHQAEDAAIAQIRKRYGKVDLDALVAVLCPILIPIGDLDRTVFNRGEGVTGTHWRARFSVTVTPQSRQIVQPGRTGKFVPRGYATGSEPWKEIAKGRILTVDPIADVAYGEVYIGGGSKALVQQAVDQLDPGDYWEVDQFGAAAKVLSGLSEYTFAKNAANEGYRVSRMPEDVAKHVSAYYNYDFLLARNGQTRRVEIKSLWGTDTRYARLIHSKSNTHKTSSCLFAAQDIFAVSLFLRTGDIHSFAYARSVPESSEKPYGLRPASEHPEYVNQNPECNFENGKWFRTIGDVWGLP